jgi:hypothetical protein
MLDRVPDRDESGNENNNHGSTRSLRTGLATGWEIGMVIVNDGIRKTRPAAVGSWLVAARHDASRADCDRPQPSLLAAAAMTRGTGVQPNARTTSIYRVLFASDSGTIFISHAGRGFACNVQKANTSFPARVLSPCRSWTEGSALAISLAEGA